MVWGLLLATALAARVAAQKFTISNGQIFTPGFAVLNAPQPDTPLGGETLHISLDVTANGQLALPPFENDDPSQIFNITVFLHSYDTGRNFTVSNGTAGSDDASMGDIMSQEDGSTVKHIDWVWPDCLVGDGEADGDDSDRGQYNISIRQNFRLNDEDYYTIFDVPIAVTNSIEDDEDRPSCEVLTNKLLSPQDIDAESANEVGILFGPDDATEVDVGKEDDDDDANDDDDKDEEDKDTSKDDSDGNGGNDDEADENDEENEGKDDEEDEPDLGGSRPEAGPEDGLGSSASHTTRIWTLSLTMMALGLCL